MTHVTERLRALDVLRGLAVLGMILVTSSGDWAAAYPQLQHAEWNGWTVADMVFPTFLFGVGMALGLSFPRGWGEADRRGFRARVLRRMLMLVVVGLALEATFNLAVAYSGGPIGRPGLANLRLPGILQRIALCYGLAALIVTATARREGDGRLVIRAPAVAAAVASLLAGYWALMLLVPVPGSGAGRLDPAGNLAGYIDRLVFTPPHLWPLGWAKWGGPIVYDPEGLLSTLPATANVLLGALAGQRWRTRPQRAALAIGAAGLALVVAGLALGLAVPINKRIWTPSFALLSGGFSAVLLGALMAALRFRAVDAVFTPARVLGGNAVLAFVAATLLGRVYDLPVIASGGARMAPRGWLDGVALRLFGEPHVAATACAVLFAAVVTALLWPLHRRAFHFRL